MTESTCYRKFHVTYFYLATGMEGREDRKDYGIINADSEDDAKEIAVQLRHPTSSRQDKDWIKGCLTARQIL